MKRAYQILAWAVAVEVVLQAVFIAWAIAGLSKWVSAGGVFDASVIESEELVFPEVVGLLLHGLNGGIIVPVIALVLVVVAFFAKIPGGVRWAVVVFVLAVVQGQLGYLGHDLPAAGAVHGLNALLLFSAAVHTARRSRSRSHTEAPAETAA